MALVYADKYCESRELYHFQLKQSYFFAFDNNLLPIKGVNSSKVVTLIFSFVSMYYTFSTSKIFRACALLVIASQGSASTAF